MYIPWAAQLIFPRDCTTWTINSAQRRVKTHLTDISKPEHLRAYVIYNYSLVFLTGIEYVCFIVFFHFCSL